MGARALPALVPVLVAVLLAAGCHRQEAVAPQPAAPATTPEAAPRPLAVSTENKGRPAPDAPFDDLSSGKPEKLAAFKGRPLLVNLWATWCVPCVKELPTLDRLAAAQGTKLKVAAISEDLEGAKVVPPFLQAHGVKALTPYHDPNNALMTAAKEASLPVSILYGADGRELWRIEGDLDWTGAKAKALLAQAGV